MYGLALPLCSPVFPAKITVVPAFSKRGRPKTLSFSRFSAKGCRKPKPAKSRQGESSLGPLFCDTGSPKTTFSGTSSNCRAVRGGGGGGDAEKPCVIDVSRERAKGGVILYPLLKLRYPTRRTMSADLGGIGYPLLGIRHAEQCRRIWEG